MIVVKATEKGHVIIPAQLRKKHHIKKGSKVSVYVRFRFVRMQGDARCPKSII